MTLHCIKRYKYNRYSIIIYFYIEPRSQSRDGFFTHLQTLHTHTHKKTKQKKTKKIQHHKI